MPRSSTPATPDAPPEPAPSLPSAAKPLDTVPGPLPTPNLNPLPPAVGSPTTPPAPSAVKPMDVVTLPSPNLEPLPTPATAIPAPTSPALPKLPDPVPPTTVTPVTTPPAKLNPLPTESVSPVKSDLNLRPDQPGLNVNFKTGGPAPAELPVPREVAPEALPAPRKFGDELIPAPRPLTEPATTTHVTVADADGNIACLTQTINDTFGARVTVLGTGILLNNCMALFDPHPGQPNSVAPGRRTISSMAPTIVLKDQRPLFALGTPGGARIFPSVAQAIINVLDHGMTLQEAVEAPRVWTQGQALEIEAAVPDAVCADLTARGHNVQKVTRVAGGMNGIVYDQATNLISGAACWRADGSPVALGGGPARPGVRF